MFGDDSRGTGSRKMASYIVQSSDMVVPGDTRIYRKIEDLKGRIRAIGLQNSQLVQAAHV